MRNDDAQRIHAQRAYFDRLWGQAALEIPAYIPHDPRLRLLGPVAGMRILDLGCGVGEWAVFLAQQGARVFALDVSMAGMRQVQQGAQLHGVTGRVQGIVADAHRLPFADRSFDLIHGQFILHHLDVTRAGQELARVLRPEGVAVFVENSANNLVLMLARRFLVGRFGIPKWSVEGEHPFRRSDFERLVALFGDGQAHYFEFHCFALADQKLFRGRSVLGWLDPLIYRYVKPLRPYGYTQWLRFRRS